MTGRKIRLCWLTVVWSFFLKNLWYAPAEWEALEGAMRFVTRQVGRNFYLCGDGTSGIEEGQGLAAPRVALCAAHEANQILELILNDIKKK